MIEISILRVMSTRDGYDKMFKAVPLTALEPLTQAIIKDIKRYYDTYTEDQKIDFVLFRDSFFRWHKCNPEDTAYYDKILRHAETDLNDVSRDVLINSMLELQLVTDTAQLLEDYHSGKEVSVIHDLTELAEQAVASTERHDEGNWIKPDMDELMEALNVENGLTFRLPVLNDSLRPLIAGDAVLVAGRPDTGKTTFIADNATHMAPQLDDRPIVWFNNEGPGQRIVTRVIQSALGISIPEMKAMHEAGTLQQAYADIIGGIDKIRVIDVHDYWNWQVEELVEIHQPKLIIMDMVDNIKFSGLSLSGGARTDQILEEMYKWSRNLGTKHGAAVVMTSQISADGEGKQYPSMDMLKDSKTGKQGALDLQIMIGKSDDPVMENSRFIGTPKNKLCMPGKAGYLRTEVIFDNNQARYVAPTLV